MSLIEILILLGVGALLLFVWVSLMRTGAQRGG